jgi:hypothetical protein
VISLGGAVSGWGRRCLFGGLAGFSVPLALQLKAHHKLALVLSRKREKMNAAILFPRFRPEAVERSGAAGVEKPASTGYKHD